MRYHYQKPDIYRSMYGETYICNHPVYNKCTLFRIGDNGLAVIQQRFNAETKSTWWGEVDAWLTDTLYLHPGFRKYFDNRCGTCKDGLYPTGYGIRHTICITIGRRVLTRALSFSPFLQLLL